MGKSEHSLMSVASAGNEAFFFLFNMAMTSKVSPSRIGIAKGIASRHQKHMISSLITTYHLCRSRDHLPFEDPDSVNIFEYQHLIHCKRIPFTRDDQILSFPLLHNSKFNVSQYHVTNSSYVSCCRST
eukprot:193684_1